MTASPSHWMTLLLSRFAAQLRKARSFGLSAAVLLASACGAPAAGVVPRDGDALSAGSLRSAGSTVTVRDSLVAGTLDASAVVEPIREATLSTKLMGTIIDVRVHEGEGVRAGQELLHIDARDLTAKSVQVAAGIADAEAIQRDAGVQARRIRALYADSAATRAQLEAVETALLRAEAAVRSARAQSIELNVLQSYATVRAPFDGVVIRRVVDPGAFATPGAPLVTVQDVSSLRISATVAAEGLVGLRRGQAIGVSIDTVMRSAVIEGIVPANAGNLFTVHATLVNPRGDIRAGRAALVHVPTASRRALLVPSASLVREGDLTGVVVRGSVRDERQWIRIGTTFGALVEVTSGLAVGDVVVVPPAIVVAAPAPTRNPVTAPRRPASR